MSVNFLVERNFHRRAGRRADETPCTCHLVEQKKTLVFLTKIEGWMPQVITGVVELVYNCLVCEAVGRMGAGCVQAVGCQPTMMRR